MGADTKPVKFTYGQFWCSVIYHRQLGIKKRKAYSLLLIYQNLSTENGIAYHYSLILNKI